MKLPKKYLSNSPLLALIAANVIPLFGAIFWGWDAFNIVFLYWAENFVVGFYNILKMAFANVPRRERNLKFFFVPFFTFHYGGFTGVHGFLVIMIFGKDEAASAMSPHMTGALVALFLSHGVSFVRNYLLKGEFVSARPGKLFFSAYPRVVVMHIAVLAGAFLAERLGSPLGLLAALIVLKTALDIMGHLWEHNKAKAFKLKLGPFSITIGSDETSIEQGVTKVADKDVLVVASKVKAYIKSKKMIASSDAVAALSDRVRAILDKAVARAKANHRRTVKPWDL